MNTDADKIRYAVKEHVSKAQAEVWEWKQKAFEVLEQIPSERRMAYIRNNTQPFIDGILTAKREIKLAGKADPKL